MCKKLQRVLIAAAITIGFGFANLLAGTIHQEYEGSWHWDELTRHTRSLEGKLVSISDLKKYGQFDVVFYKLDGENYVMDFSKP